jgi:hypothetical protein
LAASNFELTDIKFQAVRAVARTKDRYSLTFRYVPLPKDETSSYDYYSNN